MTATPAPPAPTRPCTTNPDLWFATTYAERALAIHLCLRHCPFLRQCRTQADRTPCSHGVQAGVLYTDTTIAQHARQQPKPSRRRCPTCHDSNAPAAGETNQPSPQILRRPTSTWPDCGQHKAYRRHLYHHETPCQPCRIARNEYQRGKRAERPSSASDVATRHRRTDEYRRRVDTVRTLAGLGITDRNIALRLGCSEWQVRHLRRVNDIRPGVAGNNISAAERADQVATVRRLAEAGCSDAQIGQRFGWHAQNVWRIRRIHGIPSGVGRGRPRALAVAS